MALSSLDILDTLGLDKAQIKDPNTAYEKYVVALGGAIVDLFKANPEEIGLYPGSAILQSIISVPDGSLGIEIQADDYFKFLDKGVDGTRVSHGSPYQFHKETVSPEHVQKIKERIPKRVLALPPDIATFDSFAYAIAKVVKRKGIAPKNIIDKRMTDEALQQITDDINRVTGLIVNFIFESNTK